MKNMNVKQELKAAGVEVPNFVDLCHFAELEDLNNVNKYGADKHHSYRHSIAGARYTMEIMGDDVCAYIEETLAAGSPDGIAEMPVAPQWSKVAHTYLAFAVEMWCLDAYETVLEWRDMQAVAEIASQNK